MREVAGNLWALYSELDHVICITTNGMVKKNGEAVCGRGCAKEATYYIPGFAHMLGSYIKKNGNVPGMLQTGEDNVGVFIFPVKHVWWDKASTKLIKMGLKILATKAKQHPDTTFVLPRPGCGNGKLNWETDVKPLCEDMLPNNVLVISY